MNQKFTFIFLLVVLTILNSCKPREESEETTLTSDVSVISFDPHKESNDTLKLIDVHFLKLKGPLVGKGEIIFSDKNVYLIKKTDFYIYDRSGNFLKHIDLKGSINEEIEEITQAKFNFSNNSVELLIDAHTIYTFNPLGDLLSSKDLICQVYNFQPLKDNYLLHNGFNLCGDHELAQAFSNRLTLVNYKNPNLIEKNFLSFSFDGLKNPKATMGVNNFFVSNSKCDSSLMFESFCDTIYSVRANRITPRYLIRFKGEESKISKILTDKTIVQKSKEIAKQKLTTVDNVLVNEKFVYISFHYFSKKFKILLTGYAIYNKLNKEIIVHSDGDYIPVDINNMRINFNSTTFPQFMDTDGKFGSIIIPAEFRHELDYEVAASNGKGPYHELAKKFNLKQALLDDNPIAILYNIK
jgi:hypothetical protein